MTQFLEDIIKNNKEFFDQETPFDGHLERFEQKLLKQSIEEKNPKNEYWKQVIRMAAIIVITFGAAYFYFLEPGFKNNHEQANKEVALEEVSPELAEVEQFYTSQISLLHEKIDSGPLKDDMDSREILSYLDGLEKEYVLLKQELGQNYGDERIIEAMIQNYMLRVQIIEQFLEIRKKYKTKNHEVIAS